MMSIEELEKKVEKLRAITDVKISYLREHAKFLDRAFNELKEVTEGELDIIYDRIKEIDKQNNVSRRKSLGL